MHDVSRKRTYIGEAPSTYFIVSSAPPLRPAKDKEYVKLTLPVTFTDKPSRSSQLLIVGLDLTVETMKLKIEEESPAGYVILRLHGVVRA